MLDDAPGPRAASASPFAPERLSGLRYRLGARSWSSVLDDLEAAGWEASVSGPPGSGKSAFLDGLAEALEIEGFVPWRVRMDPEETDRFGRALPRVGRGVLPDVVLLVDGADGLGAIGRFRLRRIARRTAGLVVAARHPVPGLPTLHVARPGPRLVEDLLAELLPWGPRPDRVAIRRWFLEHGGDVRTVLDACARFAAKRATCSNDRDPVRPGA